MLQPTKYVEPSDIEVIRRGYKIRFMWDGKVLCEGELQHHLTEEVIEMAIDERCEELADDLNQLLSRGLPIQMIRQPDYDPDFDN